MADLPELSDSAKRKLLLRWRTLLKANQLTGDHLHRHERERDRLARVAAQSPTPGLSRHEEDADEVGIFSSVTVAQARFNDLMVEYWRLWYSSGDGYESFAGWLGLVKRQVTDDIATIWKGESKRLDRWYKRACGPAVEEALESLVEEGIGRARAEELKRLEGPTKTSPVLGAPTVQGAAAVKRRRPRRPLPHFPNRALWLRHQLEERGWSNDDLYGNRGPDHKTVEKILQGKGVRNDVLKKVADALKVSALQIPHD